MQPKSIHNPMRPENAQTPTLFPASGDNFTTVAWGSKHEAVMSRHMSIG